MAFSLNTQVRTIFGKSVRRLRTQGILPAVIYGGGKKNIALSIIERAFEKIRKSAGESSLVELRVDGEGVEGEGTENVLIHDVDYDPLTRKPRHVDFLRVRMDKLLRIAVPLRFEGESPAVKEGGILVKVMYEVEVEALPANLPHEITVDLSRLVAIGDRIILAELSVPEGVSFVSDPESVAVLVEEPRAEEEAASEVSSESAQIEAIEIAKEKKAVPQDEPRQGREKVSDQEEGSAREDEKKTS